MILGIILVAGAVDLPPEPGDWVGLRSESALVLEVQSGSPEAWSNYCLSAWRLREKAPLKDCAANAAEPARSVARALAQNTTLNADNRWGARIALERSFLESKYKDARRLAQGLYELEPDNVWAAEMAIRSAMEGGEEAMAFALALRAKERFGSHFDGMVRRSEADLNNAYGGQSIWLFVAGILLMTLVIMRQGRNRRNLQTAPRNSQRGRS